MGFDIQRFPNCIDEELICSICAGVLQDPIQAPLCEHTFCQGCIHEWLLRSPTCPIDRTPIEIDQLKPAPRLLKTLLNRLEITCENEGCSAIVKFDHLSTHLIDCEFSPKKYFQCENGCGQSISKEERLTHNCVQALRNELNATKTELEKYRNDVDFYKNQVSTLREFLRSIRSNHFDRIENDEILRWSNDLQIARVTHWGGMISTPDVTLQETIRNALMDCSCPNDSIDLFIKNAHEKYWPQGLSTLETRQQNRQYYESYICRRIPNKQAVVVLTCDNPHMDELMIFEPGLLIIFSHGVK